jgi:hypothetical protein
MLKIEVTDISGVKSTLALKLNDYINSGENSEYISIQAADLNGNKSGVIQIKNPYYIPPETDGDTDEIPAVTVEIRPVETTQTVQNTGKPLTPDGSGTVMENVFESGSKEFFTVKTEDGSVFYLIIDRERSSDNVYFLNEVTEDDLIALAKKNGKSEEISTTEVITTMQISQVPATTAEPETKGKSGVLNTGALVFIIVAVLGIGGAAYYFKIYKNKNNTPYYDDSEDEDFDDKPDDSENYDYDLEEGNEDV